MRRIPQQIPDAVGRLLKAQHLRKQPTWYAPVMANPPPILPPYESRDRPSLRDNSRQNPIDNLHVRTRGVQKFGERLIRKPRKIVYAEDAIRKQFFRDFPFEAMRPTSLVEMREISVDHGVSGPQWRKLSQRGDYPTVENVIAFVLNLFEHHNMNYTEAYKKATGEFVELRAHHEMATMAAEIEARHYGAEFKPDGFERAFKKETAALDAHLSKTERGETQSSQKARWKRPGTYQWTSNLPSGSVPTGSFTGGQAYVQAWKKRVVVEPMESDEVAAEEHSEAATGSSIVSEAEAAAASHSAEQEPEQPTEEEVAREEELQKSLEDMLRGVETEPAVQSDSTR